MSKKKNISYLFGLAFLLLAGCDTDTATVPLPDDGERAVEVRLRASVCTVETTVGRSVIEGTALNTGDVWGIERSGFFNGREKWAKGFENQRV